MARIYHLADPATWRAAVDAGTYRESTRGMSLDEVGFIHAAFPHQVPGVRSAFYADVTTPLLSLEIDPEQLRAPLIVEIGNPATGEKFPHIHGPLNVEAVVASRELQPPHARQDIAFDVEREVARPRDVVWSRLTDWASMPQWMPGVRTMRADGEAVEGTVLTYDGPLGSQQSTVTCVWPEFILTLTSQRGRFRADYTYTLADAKNGDDPKAATIVRVIAQVSSDLPDTEAARLRRYMADHDAAQLDSLAELLTP